MVEPQQWEPRGFTEHVGMHEFRIKEGAVSVDLEVEPRHLNKGGIAHGGVLFSLLDTVMGGAVVATLNDGEWTATESMTTNFMRPALEGKRVRATGRVERRGKLTAFVKGELVDAADGTVLAFATGVWAIRR